MLHLDSTLAYQIVPRSFVLSLCWNAFPDHLWSDNHQFWEPWLLCRAAHLSHFPYKSEGSLLQCLVICLLRDCREIAQVQVRSADDCVLRRWHHHIPDLLCIWIHADAPPPTWNIQAKFSPENALENKILLRDTSQREVRRASLSVIYPFRRVLCKVFL